MGGNGFSGGFLGCEWVFRAPKVVYERNPSCILHFMTICEVRNFNLTLGETLIRVYVGKTWVNLQLVKILSGHQHYNMCPIDVVEL